MTSTGGNGRDGLLERASRALDSNGRSAVRWAFASSVVAGAAVLGVGWLLVDRLGNGAAHFAIQFAGSNDRLSERLAELTEPVGLGEAQLIQLYGGLFAAFWGLVGFVLFAVFWEHCWNAGPAARPGLARNIRYLPLAGTAVAIVEKVVTLASLRSAGDSIRLATGTPSAISSIAWAKWVLAAATLLTVFAMLVSAATAAFQRRLGQAPTAREIYDQVDDDHADVPELVAKFKRHSRGRTSLDEQPELDPPHGTGVCCSGGGIRAASFALGCLSSLERHPDRHGDLADSILGRAKYLASVSGGGYAAAAWRIAAGTDPDSLPRKPILGDPTQFAAKARRFPAPDEPAENLLEHIRERRTFLANGRGGLPLSILRFVVQTAWHLGLVFATVYAFAWPLGRLIQSWPVNALVVVPGRDAGESSIEFVLRPHQWIPPLVLFGGAALFWLIRLGFKPTRSRLIIDAVIAFFAVLSAGAALVLIALPWIVDGADHLIPNETSGQFALTGVFATIGSALWQLAKRYLRSQGRYLGGLLLAAGVGLFVTTVIKHAVIEQGWLHPFWLWIGVVIGLVGAFIVLNPDRWSLHDFYRERLSGSFVTALDDHGRPTPMPESAAPAMSEYAEARGPKPVVCCAAARQKSTETGVAALSLTFEPDAVTVYHWRPPADGQEWELHPEAISHQEYVRRLPRGQRGRLSTIMGAAAISGAAVAPSMGRMNLKSTNALLAAFNARLGVWVPNPAYPPGEEEGDREIKRMASPRLVNMFKEIFGVFDEKDPNVYATDGGHWDNLGLVELIRRRCRTIIAIDASGDQPGTYKALKEAMALAKHECGAKIEFSDEAWEHLEPDDAGLLARNYVTGTITYADDQKAELLYVKAAVSRNSLLAIQRYAAGDKTFPNYSTANQMLSDLQMTYLVRLGFESMNFALAKHPTFAERALG